MKPGFGLVCLTDSLTVPRDDQLPSTGVVASRGETVMQTDAVPSAQSRTPAGNTRLRDLRLRRQLAQVALAVVAGVSPSLVVAVERYGHRPRPETRARLARALGVSETTLWPPTESRRHEATATRLSDRPAPRLTT